MPEAGNKPLKICLAYFDMLTNGCVLLFIVAQNIIPAMLRVNYKSFRFPFEFPFAISKGVKTEQSSLLTALQMGPVLGLGEATAIPYYEVTIENMVALLEKNRLVIEKYALISPERFWHFLHHLLPENNFLIAALDMAAWDIWAQMKRQPLWKVLGLEWKDTPLTSYTIGINAPDEIAERVRQKPWPVYKLKVGSPQDLPALETLRSHTDARIRIDANEGWNLETAQALYPHLKHLQIELIEQPFHRDDRDALMRFRELCDIPLIADEACRTEADLEACISAYDGVNIKLSKCGGITPALRMITHLHQSGKKVMLGGMCENVVGATALAHLLPLADYADIDGPLLLKEHPASGISYDTGRMILPNLPGTGTRLFS